MTRDKDILNELLQISSTVANIPHQMQYKLPDDYFANLPAAIMDKIKNGNDDAATELEELSPLLNSISKRMPYKINENYFESLSENIIEGIVINNANEESEELSPLIENLNTKNVYTVPVGYFETLPHTILEKVLPGNEKRLVELAKVVKGNFAGKFMRYAAAAAIVGFVLLGSRLFFKNKNSDSISNNIANIENEVKQQSDSELNNFVDKNTMGGSLALYNDSAQLQDADVQYMLANVSDSDLQEYLVEQTGSKEYVVN